ncbi:MAG TPA: hypothetical protein VFU05_07725 [Cyclobacteriaceae bacterium]|nr:hypothetical protein [Cyclobacteriaceae bacterium]
MLIYSRLIVGVFILLLTVMSPFFSQAQGNLSNKGGYFTVVKKNNGTSQTLSVGDKIKVKLKDRQMILGKIIEVNQGFLIVDSNGKIEITQIKWIKKSAPDPGNLGLGVGLTTVGAALLISMWAGAEIDQLELIGATGITLSICGIAVLTPPKYNLDNGDKMIFKSE